MSAANRNRGARAEVAVVNYLRAQGCWPDARRYLAGDGRQPGDIDWHPLICLEVKDVAASAWPTWCRQAAAEARPGMVPVVVRRTRGVPDVGQWPVRVSWLEALETFGQAEAVAMAGRSASPSGAVVWRMDGDLCSGHSWLLSTMAELVAAVKAVDA